MTDDYIEKLKLIPWLHKHARLTLLEAVPAAAKDGVTRKT
jgi:hypothetical protein